MDLIRYYKEKKGNRGSGKAVVIEDIARRGCANGSKLKKLSENFGQRLI